MFNLITDKLMVISVKHLLLTPLTGTRRRSEASSTAEDLGQPVTGTDRRVC